MTAALRSFARFLAVPDDDPWAVDWPAVRFSNVADFRASCAGQASATVRGKLAAIKGVLKCAWRDGLLSAEELARIVDVPAPKGKTLARGRSLSAVPLAVLAVTYRRHPDIWPLLALSAAGCLAVSSSTGREDEWYALAHVAESAGVLWIGWWEWRLPITRRS